MSRRTDRKIARGLGGATDNCPAGGMISLMDNRESPPCIPAFQHASRADMADIGGRPEPCRPEHLDRPGTRRRAASVAIPCPHQVRPIVHIRASRCAGQLSISNFTGPKRHSSATARTGTTTTVRTYSAWRSLASFRVTALEVAGTARIRVVSKESAASTSVPGIGQEVADSEENRVGIV